MTDKPKTWQEIAAAVCEGGRERSMIDIGELWNAVEEMADIIAESKGDPCIIGEPPFCVNCQDWAVNAIGPYYDCQIGMNPKRNIHSLCIHYRKRTVPQ